MEEGIVKIGDYGLAKLITPSQGTEHSESIGTCHYMAPEIGSGKYNKPIDVYAMGVILYEMLTGRVPFDGRDGQRGADEAPDGAAGRVDACRAVSAIVAKALAKDPNHRTSRVYDLLPPRTLRVRPRSGSSATARGASGSAGQAGGVRPDRTTSCGSRPRSRSSTSARRPARRGRRARNLIAERLRANWEALRRPRRLPVPAAESSRCRPQRRLPRATARLARPHMLGTALEAAGPRRSCRSTAGATAPGRAAGSVWPS